MPLIEGLGDEVTIVIGILVVLIVGLLAWFSTHTSDIPFFSVIIVELSQRANRNNRQTANPSQNVGEHVEENVNNEELNANENIVHVDNSDGSSLGDVVNTALDNVNAALGLDTSVLDDDDDDEEEGDETENSEEDEDNIESEIVTSVNLGNESSQQFISSPSQEANSSEASSHTQESQQLAENELRRRRVAFFENGPSDSATLSQNTGESSKEVKNSTSPEMPVTVPTASSDVVSDGNSDTQQPPPLDAETDSIQIRVRLKYLNDTQRLVFARPLDTIGFFRRTHFSEELSQQKLVRLIFNGQDLRNETSTLQSCNIVDNSVLHCLVTQNVRSEPRDNYDTEDDINIGNFMIPIFGLLLGTLWYLRFNYKQYFNAISTLSLAGISFLFMFAAFTSWRSNNGANRENRHLD
ncbi:transmembrane and ubiquitin-like domain-containing protein 1 [Patella vulgata]|uniref:transmembrane and ubiquitin-like domain-containing protein 1 n=1 Tax=Patella vulgata TaxID=6465 RepID=UPI00217F7600|nr:transmembrane and ubiquitin-like domain-containing protein 1 [Patella vulgata]XP_050405435.1 transmembrane and ubiquitin-like domain-containing protein 1 [Patella vulgata]